jgi:hypothetical protein
MVFFTAQWANGEQFHYVVRDNSNQTGNPFLKENRVKKMVNHNGQWVGASLKD